MITARCTCSPAKAASEISDFRMSAEMAGADQVCPCATNRQSGSPMRLLTSAHTLSGSRRAWRRAPSPTTWSVAEVSSTTDGVVGAPVSPEMTSGRPPAPMVAIAELVVPRSIP